MKENMDYLIEELTKRFNSKHPEYRGKWVSSYADGLITEEQGAAKLQTTAAGLKKDMEDAGYMCPEKIIVENIIVSVIW